MSHGRVAHLEHVPLHLLRVLLVLKPPLRSEVISIITERLLVAMQHPAVGRDGHTAGEVVAVKLSALGRNKTGNVEPDSRAHAHGLLETCLEVVQILSLVPRNVACGWDDAILDGCLNFADDGTVRGCRVQDVPEERLHG